MIQSIYYKEWHKSRWTLLIILLAFTGVILYSFINISIFTLESASSSLNISGYSIYVFINCLTSSISFFSASNSLFSIKNHHYQHVFYLILSKIVILRQCFLENFSILGQQYFDTNPTNIPVIKDVISMNGKYPTILIFSTIKLATKS